VRITGGIARGVHLTVPRARQVRPTSDLVRNALFQLLGPSVVDAKVLDLYAGTGSLGIEALSRGAAFVDFVEADYQVCEAIASNKKAAGFENLGHLYRTKVSRALEFLAGPYQVILLDPPYKISGFSRTMDKLGAGGLTDTGGLVSVEHTSRIMMEESYGPLKMLHNRRYGDTTISIYFLKDI
jgi:16S rRNA (guanine966-N2)-methyltransferase